MAISFGSLAFAQNAFDEANTAYSENRYAEAAARYETLLQEQQNATLYYNLGNAYYKDKKYAKAILNYERALRLEPNHKDAKFNLEVVQSKTKDNIPEQDFFLAVWFRTIRNWCSEHTWTILSIVLFIITLTGILIFLLGRESLLRKTAFHTAWITLLFCILSGVNAYSLHKKNTLHNEAIIMQDSVEAKSSPNGDTTIFILNEGTKVTVREVLNEWVNVKVGKNEGWIPSRNLERI